MKRRIFIIAVAAIVAALFLPIIFMGSGTPGAVLKPDRTYLLSESEAVSRWLARDERSVVFEAALPPLRATAGTGCEFIVTVPSDGEFQIYLEYTSEDMSLFENTVLININGTEVVCALPLLWADAPGTVQTDRYGNEIVPEQTLLNEVSSAWLEDYERLSRTPVLFPLRSGDNAVTLIPQNQNITLHTVYVSTPQQVIPYDEYRTQNAGALEYGEIMAIEGENYRLKSDSYIRGRNVTNSGVVPNDPYVKLINAIDDKSFKTAGQKLLYEVEAPADGWYSLTVKYCQPLKAGGAAYRTLEIDGAVPFAEARDIPFVHTGMNKYANKTLGQQIYLTKGIHTIAFKVTGGLLDDAVAELLNVVNEINDTGVTMRKIKGSNSDNTAKIDVNRTWDILQYMPDILEKLGDWQNRLLTVYENLRDLSDAEPSFAGDLKLAAQNLGRLASEPREIPNRSALLSDDSGSAAQLASNVLQKLTEQNLSIDRFYLHGADVNVPSAGNSLWLDITTTVRQFVHSFTPAMNESADMKNEKDALTVWVGKPSQYVEALRVLTAQERTVVKRICRATVVFALLLPMLAGLSANAIESTSYTYTASLNNESYIHIQDAYMPGGIYLSDLGLNAPEDIAILGKTLYIADTGNGRIVRVDTVTGQTDILGAGELTAPTGVAVSSDGRVFVADYGAEQIVILSPGGSVRISRPEDLFYGKSTYKPRKIDVDDYGNIFALSEGTHEGILQFMPDGTFAGFFGANQTKGLNLVEWVQKTFYTEEQKSKLFFRNPPSIASLHVSQNNIFTVTQNDRRNSIKKLNLAGVDILPASGAVFGENNYVDLTVMPNGNIVAVTDTGSIEEFDSDGNLMFMFGGRASASDRNGLTAVVSAIAADEDYTLYVLDKERALLQTFIPTEFADTVHRASEQYMAGDYEGSLTGWEEILRINPMTSMAHSGYAAVLFQLGRYEEAAYHYRLNGSAAGYSKCFWEIRSDWLRRNMYTILLILGGLIAIIFILSGIHKTHDLLSVPRKLWMTAKGKCKLFRDTVSEPFYMLRHPIDCLYDLKHRLRGSPQAASILYILALIVSFASRIFTSFVFGGGVGWWVDPGMMLLTTAAPVALFWVGSYLVSSIHDGEGTIVQTYTALGYAFAPYILFTPILTILSHALTAREQFIFGFMQFLVIGYTCVLIFLAIKETYGYTGRQTVSNLLLTAGFMLLAALALIILFILWRQLFSFGSEMFEEAKYRVFQ